MKKSIEILKINGLLNQLHHCVISCTNENSIMVQENDVVDAINSTVFVSKPYWGLMRDLK